MTKNQKLQVGGHCFDGWLPLMSDFHFFVFVVSKAREVLVEDIALKVLLTSSDVTTCPLLPHLIHRLIHPQTVSLSNLDFSLSTFTFQYQLSLVNITFQCHRFPAAITGLFKLIHYSQCTIILHPELLSCIVDAFKSELILLNHWRL